VDLALQDPKIQELLKARAEKAAAAMKTKGADVQKSAAAEAGAVKLASGVVYRTLSAGTGKTPSRMDSVRVNYVGTLADGTKFDASADHGGPATFQLGGVVPCFSEGITRMKVGEKTRLVCPPETAYGDRDNGPIPGGSTLIFDVELLEVVAGKAAAANPAAAR
jgi:FKBP-type peptidyl-prolyl cis-trans isomerase FkpA